MKKLFAVLLTALAAGCVTPSAPVSVEDEVDSVINGLSTPYQFSNRPAKTLALSERMALYQTPGVSIAYFRNGEIVWARGFGMLEAGGEAPVSPGTIFQAASISKAVTAMTALSLVEDGVLDLDSNVEKWLGDWRFPDNPYSDANTPTLRQLLSHSAGISKILFAGYAPGEKTPTLRQMLNGEPPAKNEGVTIDYKPGSKYVYSGGTFLVVQHIIETATGRPFAEVAYDRVLAPNGMTNSWFYGADLPAAISSNAYARGHSGEGKILPGGYNRYPELAPAGLWTTPTDLAKLAIDVQKSLTGSSNHVLSQKTTEEMLTRQIGIWALGWEFMTKEGAPPSFYASGSNIGYKSIVYARMDGSEGVAIMTNGDNGGDIFFETLAGMARTHGWDELKPEQRAVYGMSSQALAAFEGEYAFSVPLEGIVIVKALAESITLEIPGFVTAREFYPESPTKFFDLGGNFVSFEFDDAGVPVTISFGDVVGRRR